MQRFRVLLSLLAWSQQLCLAQSVIINEVSQGSDGGKEWVELLVVDDGVDLRGWELGDNDDGSWHGIAEFNFHSDLATVERGTIIVIFNSGDVDASITEAGGEDTTFVDKTVLLGIDNSSFLMDIGPWGGTSGAFANSDGDDAPALRNMNDVMIHDMAVTHPSAMVSSPGSAKVKYFIGNSVAEVTDDTKWMVASSTSATPGSANGGDNSIWVDQSLAVELSIWRAASSHGEVKLEWTTDSEIENQGFIIERTLRQAQGPSSDWEEIASFTTHPQLIGQGSTSSQSDYTFTDKQVEAGKTYCYRLSDVDYSGKTTFHHKIQVTVKTAGYDSKPSDIQLHKAYPNPFNPEVNLSFTLGTPVNRLSLEIFSIHGVSIQGLSSGQYEMGRHDFKWNGTDSHGNVVSSGVYLVRLKAGPINQIQRLTLLR